MAGCRIVSHITNTRVAATTRKATSQLLVMHIRTISANYLGCCVVYGASRFHNNAPLADLALTCCHLGSIATFRFILWVMRHNEWQEETRRVFLHEIATKSTRNHCHVIVSCEAYPKSTQNQYCGPTQPRLPHQAKLDHIEQYFHQIHDNGPERQNDSPNIHSVISEKSTCSNTAFNPKPQNLNAFTNKNSCRLYFRINALNQVV